LSTSSFTCSLSRNNALYGSVWQLSRPNRAFDRSVFTFSD
jgi:hypothetical protein